MALTTRSSLNSLIGGADDTCMITDAQHFEIDKGWIMKGNNLESMSIDDLWTLKEHITLTLRQKIESEKAKLAQRLSQLKPTTCPILIGRAAHTLPFRRNIEIR
jgi:hypothetical protein